VNVIVGMTKPKLPEIQRFTKFIQLDILSGCWIWRGCLDKDGYGQFKAKGKMLFAHRFSYEYYNGKMPNGLVTDHLCRTPACVNPDHLEPVTLRENIRRGRNWNRERTHCPEGHPYSEGNTRVWKDGVRRCKICLRISWLKSYYKRKKTESFSCQCECNGK